MIPEPMSSGTALGAMDLVKNPRLPAPKGDCRPGWQICMIVGVGLSLHAAAQTFQDETISSSRRDWSTARSPRVQVCEASTWTFPIGWWSIMVSVLSDEYRFLRNPC